MSELRMRLAEAALPHVPFDGWSEASLLAAAADLGIDPRLARLHAPRGGIDLALAAHAAGDARLGDALAARDLSALRFRDRMLEAIMLRLSLAGGRDAVGKASALFALPHHMGEGLRAIWRTSDLIWTLLGDTAQDLNWYSKRASLAAVYSATVLYWLGDESEDFAETRAFAERRIATVMGIEKAKAGLRANPLTRPLAALQGRLAALVPAPAHVRAAHGNASVAGDAGAAQAMPDRKA